jgi:hypothetical protein
MYSGPIWRKEKNRQRGSGKNDSLLPRDGGMGTLKKILCDIFTEEEEKEGVEKKNHGETQMLKMTQDKRSDKVIRGGF